MGVEDLFADGRLLARFLDGVLAVEGDRVRMHDGDRFREKCVERLLYNASFHPNEALRGFLRWLIRDAARALGIHPASIRPVHDGIAAGAVPGVTVPALELRVLPYDVARGCFRAMHAVEAGPVLFQLAHEASAWTRHPPAELAACVFAAAIRERHQGPVFLQLEHLRLDAWSWELSPEDALDRLEDTAARALAAGFRSLQIDATPLADIAAAGVEAQLLPVARGTAALAARVRGVETPGFDVCLGAELGVSADRRALVRGLRAFMDRFVPELATLAGDVPGLSKIALHGGPGPFGAPAPLPRHADPVVDEGALRDAGEVVRRSYRLAGVVQHDASALTIPMLSRLPAKAVCEVHFARLLQDAVIDHPDFPVSLRRRMRGALDALRDVARAPRESDEAFHHRALVRVLGRFKRPLRDLPEALRAAFATAAEERVAPLLDILGLRNTVALTRGDTLGHVQEEPVGVPRAGLFHDAEGMFRALSHAPASAFQEEGAHPP